MREAWETTLRTRLLFLSTPQGLRLSPTCVTAPRREAQPQCRTWMRRLRLHAPAATSLHGQKANYRCDKLKSARADRSRGTVELPEWKPRQPWSNERAQSRSNLSNDRGEID